MKLISLRIDEKLLSKIDGNISDFIRDAVYEKLYGDGVQLSMMEEVETEVCEVFGKHKGTLADKSAYSVLYRMYHGQVSSSKRRGHKPPKYGRDAFINHWLENPTFKVLYDKYEKSNFKNNLVPSVDRLDDGKTYSFKNTQILSWGDHMKLTGKRNRGGVSSRPKNAISISVDGVIYPSLVKAAEICFGNRNHASSLSLNLKIKDEFMFNGKKVKKQ